MKLQRVLPVLLALVVALAAACTGSGTPAPTAVPPTTAPSADTNTAVVPTTAPTDAPGSGDTNAPSGAPVDAIRAYFEALYAGEDTAPFLCSEENADMIVRMIAETAAATEELEGMTPDVSGLTFTVASESANEVVVTVGGTIVWGGDGTDLPLMYQDSEMRVVNEGGSWKFCGNDLS